MLRTPYLLTGLILGVIFLGSPNFRFASGPEASPYGGDFLQEWIGGHIVLQGDYARFYEVSYAQELEHNPELVGYQWKAKEYFPIVYPPFYYLLVSPLSLLPNHAATLLWAAGMVFAYAAAWRLFQSLFEERNATEGPRWRAEYVWLLPLSLFFMPLIENFTSCQKASLLLLIYTGTFKLLRSGRPFWAGLLFGLIAFKPQFALPLAIVMLCKGQWRFVLGGFTTGTVLVGICLAMGLDVCQQYVEFSRHAQEYMQYAGYDLTKSHEWRGFFTLLMGESNSRGINLLTALATAVTIGVVTFGLWRKLDTRSPQFTWQFSFVVVETILLSPHLYTYDLTVLLLPLGLLAVHSLGEREQFTSDVARIGQRWLVYMGLLIFCLAGLSPRIAAATGVQITVPLLFAFLCGLAWQVALLEQRWGWLPAPRRTILEGSSCVPPETQREEVSR